jgi:hypothetical protein
MFFKIFNFLKFEIKLYLMFLNHFNTTTRKPEKTNGNVARQKISAASAGDFSVVMRFA